MQFFPNTLRQSLAILFLLGTTAALLYWPALHAPWYMDDMPAIVRNPLIRDLQSSVSALLRPRGLVIFSFALNYHFGGTDPFGYHLVNLALHIGCSLLVFLLLRQFLPEHPLLAALGALLFVAHPLQTQAVTYVVQRMAVLAAFFFLLSVCLFVRARQLLASGKPFTCPSHLGCYAGAVAAGACAVFAKENTAVLPLVLYSCVVTLLPVPVDRRRLQWTLLPFLLAPLLLVAVRLISPLLAGQSLAGLAGTAQLANAPQLSPWHYLVTEFAVGWIYLRMLLLPVGQALDHSYPVVASLFSPLHLLAGAGLALLGALAFYCRRRQPLLSAGIAWFFLTLAVESTFIPLDPLFEHRLYLPMFGFVLAILGMLCWLPGKRLGPALLGAFLLVCLPLTWQRNRLWAEPLAFYRDNLAKVPHSERVLSDLAYHLIDAGQLDEAEQLLLQAMARNPRLLAPAINLIATYGRQGRLREAFSLCERLLIRNPDSEELLTALGAIYFKAGDGERALELFATALQRNPDYVLAQSNRAAIFAQTGRFAEAEMALRNALQITPRDVLLRNDLALALKMQGKTGEAEEELRRILVIDPENRQARQRLGLADSVPPKE